MTLPPYRMTKDQKEITNESVNHPKHYTSHPSGVECIQITEHMGFCIGNAIKYLWRASLKGKEIEDLRKARWYIDREIARLVGKREVKVHEQRVKEGDVWKTQTNDQA